METGKFETAFHAEKKKPNSDKILNFDTLWSASEYGGSLHNYEVLPWPLQISNYPEHWPETVGRHWLQARRSIQGENWDAAAVMA